MTDAFVLGGVRTPVGRYGGSLSHIRTDDLLGQTMVSACERVGVPLVSLEEGIPLAVGDYSLTQLYAADELFVTGTMGGLTPVISLDGRPIAAGKPGEITKRLTRSFASLTETAGVAVT